MRTKVIALLLVLVIIAGFVGWRLGSSNDSTNNGGTNSNTSQFSSSGNAESTDVKNSVSYTLPDEWDEGVCPVSNATIYIIPPATSLNCNAKLSAPIKLYVDPQNTTDCQQLKPASTQNIKKHICSSLYIDGHKSLKSLTEYNAGSSYKTNTTISDYYINIGKGVVAIEYTYTTANDFQVGFDQLAKSIKVKG